MQPLQINPEHESELMEHPAVRLHNITSILAIPIKMESQNGMWYFERWEPEPAVYKK